MCVCVCVCVCARYTYIAHACALVRPVNVHVQVGNFAYEKKKITMNNTDVYVQVGHFIYEKKQITMNVLTQVGHCYMCIIAAGADCGDCHDLSH